jgi:hypothetical protein
VASAWGLRGAALEDALALNDLQAGAGGALPVGGPARRAPPDEPWSAWLPRLTLEGGDALALHFCHLATMRAHSPRTAALLAHLQAYTAAHAPRLAARPAHDVVHFDFGGHNILVAGGRVTGVVDWELPAPAYAGFLFHVIVAGRLVPVRRR